MINIVNFYETERSKPRSLATADPSLVAQTSSFLAAARAESDNAKKAKTSGFVKPKDDD